MRDNINIVYGNIGTSSGGAENIISYLRACLLSATGKVRLTYAPVPGQVNFIVDNFSGMFENIIVKAASLGTRFIVVATENIHENGYWLGERTPFLDEHNRFQSLMRTCNHASAIWCLGPLQVEPYRNITGHDKVFYLPHGYVDGFYDFLWEEDSGRDIDFYFSGSLTEYRRDIISRLTAANFRCVCLGAETCQLIRNEAISRSKVCLALRQSATWTAPSVVRLHYHLMAKSFVLAEKCEEASELDDYIELVDPDDLIEVCIETAVRGGTARLGERQHQRFREERNVTPAVREMLAASLAAKSDRLPS